MIKQNTYDCCLFRIKIALMFLNAFLAAKEYKAIAQILFNLPISLSAQAIALYIMITARIVRLLNLSISPT